MQANWSLVLNILLLIGVITLISRMMKARRQDFSGVEAQPSIGETPTPPPLPDDIIAVRQLAPEAAAEVLSQLESTIRPNSRLNTRRYPSLQKNDPMISTVSLNPKRQLNPQVEPASSLMMFLLAKENRQLAGYELLQTVLAAGLRFGEGHLFHRHQSPNGQGPVLCSLAAATPSGVFDMQNIGAFSVHGLCLFMHASGNPTIDAERFSIMLDTAKQLSEGLDTHLLDDQRRPLTDQGIQRYYRLLSLNEATEALEPA